MNGVLITVSAELFQFQACGGIATVLSRRIAGDTRRARSWIRAALSTF